MSRADADPHRSQGSRAARRSRRRRAALPEPKIDAQGRAYATGKRKNAVARVWIKPGTGRITVNGRDIAVYFARPVLRMLIEPAVPGGQPHRTSTTCRARSSAAASPARPARCATASAARSPISSRACAPVLKTGGFLTRDSRVVERKKYGKAQGATQLPVLEALDIDCNGTDVGGAPFEAPRSSCTLPDDDTAEGGRTTMASGDNGCGSAFSARAAIPGAELVRLLARHPPVEIRLLTADRQAGKPLAEVFPHLGRSQPAEPGQDRRGRLVRARFRLLRLPHGTTQEVIAKLPRQLKVVDLSADFRLADLASLCAMVRPCASRAGAAEGGGLRPDRDPRDEIAHGPAGAPIPAAIRPRRSCR